MLYAGGEESLVNLPGQVGLMTGESSDSEREGEAAGQIGAGD
jgi:hypothetical protein